MGGEGGKAKKAGGCPLGLAGLLRERGEEETGTGHERRSVGNRGSSFQQSGHSWEYRLYRVEVITVRVCMDCMDVYSDAVGFLGNYACVFSKDCLGPLVVDAHRFQQQASAHFGRLRHWIPRQSPLYHSWNLTSTTCHRTPVTCSNEAQPVQDGPLAAHRVPILKPCPTTASPRAHPHPALRLPLPMLMPTYPATVLVCGGLARSLSVQCLGDISQWSVRRSALSRLRRVWRCAGWDS